MTQAPSTAVPLTAPLPLNQGAAMPRVGLGVFRASPDEAYAAVREALAAGYRHIDTAQIYGNEQAVGQAVRDSGLPLSASRNRPEQAEHNNAPRSCMRRSHCTSRG
jgi:diketogulonate reductase-like aldo/keto reductase